MLKKIHLSFAGAAFALLMILAAGCHSTPKAPEPPLSRYQFEEPHMGTLVSITLYAPSAYTANAAAEAAFRTFVKLEHIMSNYETNSEVMQLCRRPVGEPTHVSPELFEILQESVRVAKEPDGAFDVTVGPFVHAWRTARKTKVLPTPEQIAE